MLYRFVLSLVVIDLDISLVETETVSSTMRARMDDQAATNEDIESEYIL